MMASPISPLVAALAVITLMVGSLAHGQQPATAPQQRGVIELMNQMESLNADLNRLRGQIEVLNNSLDNAQRRQRDMYLDLDTRLRRLEQSASSDAAQKQAAELDARVKKLEQHASPDAETKQAQQLQALDTRLKRLEQAAAPAPEGDAQARTSGTAAVAAPTPPGPPNVQRPTPPSTAAANGGAELSPVRRAYDNALSLYRTGDYQGAIAAFDAFVKRYPRDALAANAQYWIGDAWFNLRDFRAAAASQQALIASYPDSPKVPDAMLNLSSAQLALGDSAQAKKTLEDVVSRYPQTDAAEKARQRLGSMR